MEDSLLSLEATITDCDIPDHYMDVLREHLGRLLTETKQVNPSLLPSLELHLNPQDLSRLRGPLVTAGKLKASS